MPDYLVKLLCDATGDAEPAAEDVELARQADGWLDRNGWQPHWRMGYVNKDRGLSFTADDFGPEPALVVTPQVHGLWSQAGETSYRLPNMRAALNMLGVVGILPGRFTTFGRDALHDHAEACERAADALETRGADQGATAYDEAVATAEGLRQAAASARRHYPLRAVAA